MLGRIYQFWKGDARNRWVLLGLSAIIIRLIFSLFPVLAEYLYSRGIFPVMRMVWDHSLALLPFPLIYILILFLIWRLIRRIRLPRRPGSRIRQFGWDLAGLIGAAVFLFFTLWGFNYSRIPIEEQLGLSSDTLDYFMLEADFLESSEKMNGLRRTIPARDSALSEADLPVDLHDHMRDLLESQLSEMGYPVWGEVRVKRMHPPGALAGLGISGIYMPFCGEAYIPADLPAAEQPFTIAHEMAHGYGFGDEGVCNFLAYLACEGSDRPLIRYSGEFIYWRKLARDYADANDGAYYCVRDSLDPDIRSDLRFSRNYYRTYRGWMSGMSRSFNDAYLRVQGVRGGVSSYNRMTSLIHAWRRR